MQIRDKYKLIVSEDKDSIDALACLQQKVNLMYVAGWEAQGGVAITHTTEGKYCACQAMVKK